ncbi:MAG: apolipoprotein N-acyltransferase [Gammaproteobacteria bacterium]|nr:apolipoprotein N-acyltransferase [Gammaproteobacteria bacterium]
MAISAGLPENRTTRKRFPLLTDLIALVGGYLMALGFAPYDIWPLATACFAVFVFCISRPDASPRRALLRGYLFGLGMFCFETSWVYISLHYYGGAGMIEAVMLCALAAAFYALFPLLAAAISIPFLRQQSIVSMVLISPSVWILVEWLRAGFFFGFPWLQIGSAMLDTPLAGFIPIIGGYGTGWLAAFSAASLVYLGGLIAEKKILSISLITGVLVSIWVVGSVLQSIEWTRPVGQDIRVALIQGNTAQDKKWDNRYKQEIIRNYVELTRQHWDADLIVWPESSVPAYYHHMLEFYERLTTLSQNHHSQLLIGTISADQDTGEYYNTVIAPGQPVQMYRKRHLVPFGEYLPFQPVSGWIARFLDMPMSNFSAGDENQPLLTMNGMPFVTTICYEDSYPDLNLSGMPEAAFIVNVSNDAWFADSIAPHQHLQHARMRSLETGRYTLRATNNGITAIINPEGKVTERIPQFITAVLTGRFTGMQGTTPYIMLGDSPVLVLLFSLIGIVGLVSIRPGTRART